jgi:hypothetical protein
VALLCRFRHLWQVDLQESVLERGRDFRDVDFRRQIDDSQELVGALLLIDSLALFLLFLGLFLAADREPPRLKADFQLLGAEFGRLRFDG